MAVQAFQMGVKFSREASRRAGAAALEELLSLSVCRFAQPEKPAACCFNKCATHLCLLVKPFFWLVDVRARVDGKADSFTTSTQSEQALLEKNRVSSVAIAMQCRDLHALRVGGVFWIARYAATALCISKLNVRRNGFDPSNYD